MIELKKATKRFGDVTAVDHLTLTMSEGVYGLIGQNGAGKSTLLRSIAGVLYLDEGEILVNGHNARSFEAKKDVFFLPDNPYSPTRSDPEGVYEFYNAYYNVDKARYDALIDKFELPRTKRVSTYSKGMQRQLFLSLAFAVEAKILLLDEAFDGLDPLALLTISDELLKKRAEGVEVVISSHNLSSLEKIADRFVILYKGQLSKEGENEDLGEEMVKYQAVFPKDIAEADLASLGIKVISLKKVGSITNFVIQSRPGVEEEIRKALSPTLLENIPMDPEEILALQLSSARKEHEND